MDIPDHIQKCAKEAIANLLPTKSASRYDAEYQKYKKWCEQNNINESSETTLLAYFKIKSEVMKASTLWTMYSMLKSTLSIKDNVNIDKFHRLVAFLKRQNDGYKAKKSDIFTECQMESFLNRAPDEKFLLIKSALIIGISGACRKIELVTLCTDNVKFVENMIVITLCDTKTKRNRTFVITNEAWVKMVSKYHTLRPPNTDHKRFFVYFANSKCTRQPVGVNTFGSMPRKIAEFLQLPSPERFTGHSFRRSSATILAAKGVDFLSIKRHGGWRSSTVAEGYIEDSLCDKIAIANQLTSQTLNNPSSSTFTYTSGASTSNDSAPSMSNFTLQQSTADHSATIQENHRQVSAVALQNINNLLLLYDV